MASDQLSGSECQASRRLLSRLLRARRIKKLNRAVRDLAINATATPYPSAVISQLGRRRRVVLLRRIAALEVPLAAVPHAQVITVGGLAQPSPYRSLTLWMVWPPADFTSTVNTTLASVVEASVRRASRSPRIG